jgi:Fe-S cluster assembly protein SufD
LTRVEVLVKKGGKVQFLSCQQLPLTSQFVGRYGFSLGEHSSARVFCLGLGAQLSRIDLDCRLEGVGAEADIGALAVLRDEQHHDFRPIQQHDAPGCRSDLLAKNVVLERGRAVYYGLIKVAEEAQKTDAYQTNRNLILSPNASVDSIPNLEIAANDVKCSHGSSTGQLGEDDLFYMAARGIPRHLAELLLVEGFAGDVLNRVIDDTVRQSFAKSVEERITGEA